MRITKYKQSCLLIESRSVRILVDPGSIDITEDNINNDWVKIDAILVTHKHTDHINNEAISRILQRDGAQLYTGKEVLQENPDLFGNAVKIGERFFVKGIEVKVAEAKHGWNPKLRGKEVADCFGYILSSESKNIYITGDTVCFDNQYKCDVLCMPVSDAGLVMGTSDGAMFAEMLEAKIVIPTHYDNPNYPVDINKLMQDFKDKPFKYYLLNTGESVDV